MKTKGLITVAFTLALATTVTSSQSFANDKIDCILTADKLNIHKIITKNTNVLTAILIGKEINIDKHKEITLICTFYTSLPSEGGGLGLTASGKKISRGMVASNYLAFGTRIQTEEYGELVIEDRGNPNYFHYINDNTYRIDIFIPRNKGESDKQYKQRVKNMGVQTIKGKLMIEN